MQGNSQSSFWAGYLEGVSCTFPSLVEESASTPESRSRKLRISCSSTPRTLSLETLCRTHGLSPEHLHLAAWSILLGRYLGDGQVCFGTIEKSSHSASFSVCCVQLSKTEKTSTAVFDCRQSFEECRPHACRSAAELIQQIGPEQRLFNTAVYLDLVEPQNSVRYGRAIDELPEFDMILVLRKSETDIQSYLEYSSLLSSAAAALVAATYRTIVSELTESFEWPLGQLCVMSQDDLDKTWSWNRTCPKAVESLVQDLFQRNVISQPDAPAVCASDASFTYQELDRISNVLANFLVGKGVKPDVVVPLCFEKSAWATVAMLAVIKAGAAFTFLDASYPMDRLEGIIQQVNAQFLLSSTANMGVWKGHRPAYEVSAAALAALPQEFSAPHTAVTPSNLLYIIFTSGSTGKPKGVCIEHSNYLSCALHQSQVCNMRSSSRVLQFASYSFDVSVLENFTTLVCGGCVCIPDETSRSKGIASIMNEFQITWAFLTPSLVKLIGPQDVPTLETLVLGGEALSKSDVETWAGKLQLMDGYGPTECSIASSIHPAVTTRTEAGNIGWPVGGLLWVVDTNDPNQLVPIGGIGELAIEGPHLAREYLDDPEKTAKAFIENTEWMGDFPASRKRRIYLTGDLVRRNTDGSIHFIGRKDAQVKIRGLRIELGEIEHHIQVDPLVNLAIVVAPNAGACKKRLVALISLSGTTSDSNTGLKVINTELEEVRNSVRYIQSHLGEKVPGYMVPSTWLVLESFALTPSGKIDRVKVKKWIEGMDVKTLSESECLLDRDETQPSAEVPNDIEASLRGVIGHVLNLSFESVTPSRSFVNLGGDSISAMQLVSRCKLQGMTVKVKDILRCKSITELATCVDAGKPATVQEEEVYDVPFALSPIQQLYFDLEPNGTHIGGANRFNQSFLLRLKQKVPTKSISAALEVLVERHSMLRCRFIKSKTGAWQQVIPSAVDGSWRFAEHGASSPDGIQSIIIGSQCEIEGAEGPVFVADLINNAQGQLLSMIAHHAVIDLVSWRVIMQELEELIQKGALSAPQKPLPWQVWCKMQAEYASQYLPPRVAFPDKIEFPNLGYWGMEGKDNMIKHASKVVFQLDAATTSLLTNSEVHRSLRTDLIDILLAAIIHSFSLVFQDRESPVIFRESHGREPWDDSIDIGSTVGWFTSMYPVYVEAGKQLVDTIRRVKDTQRRVPRNGWPYFASRYNHPEGIKEFGSHTRAEIQFDYLGLYQQLEREDSLFEQEPWINSDVGDDFNRFALFEITAEVVRGKFQLTFEYNTDMDHQDEILQWIQECENILHQITWELSHASDARFTLSDFPLLKIDYEGLDNLVDSTLPQFNVSPENVEEIYGTSPMQTGLLLSQAKDESMYQYFIVFKVEATSAFESADAQRLSDAWQAVVDRHSSLRTIFVPGVSNGNVFNQVVLKSANMRIARIRCSARELHGVLNERMHIPVQDSRPPHKFTICEVENGDTFIRIDINHALVDGSSVAVLVRDIIASYDGRTQLPRITPYRDFIAHVQGYDLERSLKYWTSYLDGVEPCYLPVLDDGVAQDGTIQTVQVHHQISIQSLNRFGQEHNVTLPTLFKAVWALILQIYTGSNQVCFGYLVSGRDVPMDGIENAIGAFINILVCRVDMSNTLGSIFDKIQEDSVAGLQHQHCSLAHVQQSLGSGLSAQPLFNTALNFQVQPNIERSDSAIALKIENTYDPTEFSIAVDVAVIGEKLDISLAHRTSSVGSGQAKNIAKAFETALSLVVESPSDLPANKMDLFGESHREQVWAWNRSLPEKMDMCIHDVISRQASARPGAPAVESWDASFTYTQLEDTSTRLGIHLSHLGVRSGAIVPLCFQKSAWTIVAMLAVMKAGGAFVLLDPKHISADRTRGIIEDTEAKLVVSDSTVLADIFDNIVVVSGSSMEVVKSCPTCRQQSQQRKPSPNDPAYIIFTSGTTGKPKGCVITHSAFTTSAASHGKASGLSPRARVLQYASYTFDACLLEILTVLMFGGCVCVPTEQSRMDDVTGALRDFGITWAVLTPSVSRLITPGEVSSLKTLVLAGEAMSQSDITRWKGHVTLQNGYGPSECSVACAWHPNVQSDPTNIGRSVGGLCWIVDPEDHERLLPVGAIGELIVEGFIVANGYLNNEAKTSETFIKPPKWLVGQRSGRGLSDHLYKTGDLVRYNSDGTINFIGRKDTQVKFHGQRIEVGEIEHHVLSRSNIISGVAVEVIKPAARQYKQTLVAFITIEKPKESQPFGHGIFFELADDIAAHLQVLQDGLTEVLPSYMIPTAFFPTIFFPRSASGKLDRKTLRKVAEEVPADLLNEFSLITTTKRAPTSETEKLLQKAWARALGTPQSAIGSDTSFFRIGGDSLNAMALVSAARDLGLAIAVADIFGHPKLSEMARFAQYLRDSEPEVIIQPFTLFGGDDSIDELVAIVAEQCDVPRKRLVDLYPCTPLQEGLIALSMKQTGAYLGQNAFRLAKTMDIGRFVQAWEKIVELNPILRTRIVSTETAGNLQAVLDTRIDWLRPTCSVEEYLRDDLLIPITWGSSLARYALITTPQDGTYFVWTAHHALFDGWSQGLVFEQLEQAYHGRPLPVLTPFNRFIDFLANSDDVACTDFWTSQLDGDSPATLPQLPSSNFTPKADQCYECIVNVTKESGSDIMTSTILRAAWALVTARYLDAEDVVFGATMSGRNAPVHNIARINGPTITTVPIKIHVDRDQPISDFLENVQAQATEIIPFEHWGLQNIAQLSKNAKFQNLLVVQPGRDEQGLLGLEVLETDESDFNTYALIVECILIGDKVKLKMTYDNSVVPYAPQLANHFQQLIKQLADRASEESPLRSLVFCSPEDKAQVFSWNREDPKWVEKCIHDLVSRQARKNPNGTAVCSWDLNMSYEELDVMSTKLARHLVYRGVRPEKVVPAVFEKSAWTVVAQLAILKAGGAMCMLDPSNPVARLETIIETVEADLILASEMHSSLLQTNGRRILTVNATTMERLDRAQSAPTPTVSPINAAYVVFTSGTTGKPKGSITEHRAFASQSAALAPAMQISASSRVLQYAAYSFDPYILETFTTLMEGGCVCIVKDEARTNPADLVDIIGAFGVTWALLTPSVARLLPKNGLPNLKTLILGGEAMARADKTWSNVVTLMNAYGPSECSVASVLNRHVTQESEHMNIGWGVGGRCWIVEPDDHNSLAPVGCSGELLIESPGLSRGYLKEPKKTADVFITSPAWLKNIRANSRLYKTGDLVRYNPADGTINFIGRKDTQVKLHGQRLELGEIEHQLSVSNYVENVAVTLPGAGNFKGKLVATLSLKSLATSKAGDVELELVDALSRATAARQLTEIRNHLESHVPSYMVPSVWTVVYGIPLTLSLKINKRKITTWLENMSEEMCREAMNLNSADEPSHEASTTMEQRLKEIVAKVLNIPVDQVLLNRSFIGLGGDSITAMQVVARCRTENITVHVKDILQSKSIVKVAECATSANGQEKQFEKEFVGTYFSLTPIQKLYFEAGLGVSQETSHMVSGHFNQSNLVQLRRRVTTEQLGRAIQAIVQQHTMLRARFSQNRRNLGSDGPPRGDQELYLRPPPTSFNSGDSPYYGS